jgi:Lon protease-like protein
LTVESDGDPTDPGDTALELPLFPLGSPLLPQQLLPLQIFEPRYVQMFAPGRLEAGGLFGVVMIERGREVGGGEVRSDTGCTARLLEIRREPSGKAVLMAVGEQRFEVLEWLPDSPHPRARVSLVPDTQSDPDSSMLDRLAREAVSVASLACELGGPPVPAHLELAEDPVARLWQICLISPLGSLDRHHLLCCADAATRQELLGEQLAMQRELLEARLGSG